MAFRIDAPKKGYLRTISTLGEACYCRPVDHSQLKGYTNCNNLGKGLVVSPAQGRGAKVALTARLGAPRECRFSFPGTQPGFQGSLLTTCSGRRKKERKGKGMKR